MWPKPHENLNDFFLQGVMLLLGTFATRQDALISLGGGVVTFVEHCTNKSAFLLFQ